MITYILQLVDTIGANTPAAELTNTATLDRLLSHRGRAVVRPDHAGRRSSPTLRRAATKPLTVAKQRTSTSQASTTGSNVAIGEEVEYTVTVTVPEGVSRNVTLVDTLPAGLEISRPPVAAVLGSDLSAAAVDRPDRVGEPPQVLTYGFGDITNSDSDNATTANETITFTYWAVVTNVNGNQRGTVRTNSAVVSYLRGATGTTTSTAIAGTPVTVVEPTLRVAKAASSPHDRRRPTTFTYSITVDHDPSSNADAFEVALTDVIPAGLIYQTGRWRRPPRQDRPRPPSRFTGPDTIDATWTDAASPREAPPRSPSTSPSPPATTRSVRSRTPPRSPTPDCPARRRLPLVNPNGVERTGVDGPGGLNDYATSGVRGRSSRSHLPSPRPSSTPTRQRPRRRTSRSVRS